MTDYPSMNIRANEEEKERCNRLAEQAGFLFNGEGNKSGFLRYLIREGRIQSVNDIANFLATLDDDERVFVVKIS